MTEVYRCSLLIQEPYSDSLADRNSDDFDTLSEKFSSAVENVYSSLPGFVTATVQTFESVGRFPVFYSIRFNFYVFNYWITGKMN